jgi:parallel beta-helix repeat protein
MTTRVFRLTCAVLFAAAWGGCASLPVTAPAPRAAQTPTEVNVARFLPVGFAQDGSVSYESALQLALDHSPDGATIVFPPCIFRLESAAGLRVPANRTLVLDGATFLFAAEIDRDGEAFLLDGVSEVTVRGGTIIGRRDEWPESVNVAGIRVRGSGAHIRVEGTRFYDLSSNAVGVFGDSLDHPLRNVWIEDIYTENCCNLYYDYLSEQRGPAEGSLREDQGAICFYNVSDFVVQGSYLDGSRSDGTHFKGCRNGQITDNQIVNSQMGGFFLEGCQNIVATGNLMRNNGSRGCTIERDSTDCILSNNIVERSGREGLWAPDVARIVVSGNIFRENGQKDDEDKDSEIRINDESRYPTVPADIRIEGNVFQSTKHCNGVIQVNAGAGPGISISNNSFTGPVRTLIIESSFEVLVAGNTGLNQDAPAQPRAR